MSCCSSRTEKNPSILIFETIPISTTPATFQRSNDHDHRKIKFTFIMLLDVSRPDIKKKQLSQDKYA